MKFVYKTTFRIHFSAFKRFTAWSRGRIQLFEELKAMLIEAQGKPIEACQINNRTFPAAPDGTVDNELWAWEHGGTFLTYIIKDRPLAAALPFFVERRVVLVDIFAP